MWAITQVEDVFREVCQAARVLRRTPGHSSAVIILLALGIGVNAAMFSLVNALFIRELPVHEPDRLVTLSPGWPTALFEDFRRLPQSFSGLLAAGSMSATVVSTQAGEQLTGVAGRVVSGNYFQVLGMQTAIGRVFTEADDNSGDPKPVMVISHAFWRRQFGGDLKALGQQILLGGTPFLIIGVAPAEFTGDSTGLTRDFWVPLNAQVAIMPQGDARRRRSFPWLSVMGRLKPGVSVMQAQAEAEAVYTQIAPVPTQPRNRGSRVRIEPASRGFGGVRGQLGTPVQILAGTVVVVLLVVWANVATLLLARGAARQREMAVRQALGCSRSRLFRQVLLEGLLLAGAGGLIGMALAPGSARALLAMQPSFDRIDLNLSLDSNVLMFGAAVSVLTALAFSLAPALRASHANIQPALKSASGASTAGRQRTIRFVIAVQVALSVVLVAASFLFTRSLMGLHTVDTGFDREHILSVAMDPALAGYRDTAVQGRLGEQLVERLSGLPGVKSASVGLCAVLMGCSRAAVVSVEGRPVQADDPSVWINPVSPNYFETTGIPLVMGRGFGRQDRPGSTHVAVVTEALARFYFPGQNPLGKRFTEPSGAEPIEIVGVARDVKFVSPRDAPIRMAFLSLAQIPGPFGYVQIRTEGAPERLVSPVRRAIIDVDPKFFLRGPDTLSSVLDRLLARDVLLSRASGLFGIIALLLACFGVYGVISYLVAARAGEFGIRLALGAQPGVVMRHIIVDALKTVMPGIIVGICAAWGADRLIESVLFGVSSRDFLTHAVVAISLLLTTVLAAWLPALRASRIDPLRTLRAE